MTTPLRERAEEYLRLRRALGFRLRHEGYMLPQFAATWSSTAPRPSPPRRDRVGAAPAKRPSGDVDAASHRRPRVRGLAARLSTRDGDPAQGRVPRAGQAARSVHLHRRATSPRMTAACSAMRPAMRAATCTALFGLIAVTGIRIREALSIPADGIDLDAGLLPVMPAKSRCERILPAAPQHRRSARGIRRAPRPRLHPAPRRSSCPQKGTRLSQTSVVNVIPEGLRRRGHPRQPRIHDAEAQPGRQCAAGVVPVRRERRRRRCRRLSGYLGHVEPRGTFWYISAVPELMQLAAARAAGKEDAMSDLAPVLQEFFTRRLISQRTPAPPPSPPTATRSGC